MLVVPHVTEQRAIAALALAAQQRQWATVITQAQELLRLEGTAPVEGFAVAGVDAIFDPLPPVDWLLEGLEIAPGAPTLVAGYGFSGKTVALQSMVVTLAAEGNWIRLVWGLHRARVAPVRCVHLDWEQGPRLTRMRYQRLVKGLGLTQDTLGNRVGLVSLAGKHLDSPGAADAVKRACDGAGFAVIDSLRAACPSLDENSSEIRAPLDMLTRISEEIGCCFGVVHHARKPSKDAVAGAKYTVRGSGALFDACQSVLVFAAEKGRPTLVQHEKARVNGRLAPDFTLAIKDTDDGGLVVKGAAVDSAEVREQQAKEEVQLKIVETLQRVKSVARKEDVFERIGGTKQVFVQAWTQLVDEGIVVDSGTGNKSHYYHLAPGLEGEVYR